MTLSENEKNALVEVKLENAWRTLNDAQLLLSNGSLRGAMNRAYYAMFHGTSALAISRGFIFKKHTQLIGFFQKEYAKSEILDRKHGRSLQKAFEDRSEADYQDFVTFEQKQVEIRIAEAKAFVEVVAQHIQRMNREP